MSDKATKKEGDPGTWSHCGNSSPHSAHTHTVVFNEGPYQDVHCNGTPATTGMEEAIRKQAEEFSRLSEKYVDIAVTHPADHPARAANLQEAAKYATLALDKYTILRGLEGSNA